LHQETTGDIRRHQEDIRRHQKTSKDIGKHWKTSKGIKSHPQKATKGIERHQKASKGIKRHQKTYALSKCSNYPNSIREILAMSSKKYFQLINFLSNFSSIHEKIQTP
jgi:hypothetical protein